MNPKAFFIIAGAALLAGCADGGPSAGAPQAGSDDPETGTPAEVQGPTIMDVNGPSQPTSGLGPDPFVGPDDDASNVPPDPSVRTPARSLSIEGPWVSRVASFEATFQWNVSGGPDLVSHAEYGWGLNLTQSNLTQSTREVIGSGAVELTAWDLQPATAYRVRVVATDGSGSAASEEVAFVTSNGPLLGSPGGTLPPWANDNNPPFIGAINATLLGTSALYVTWTAGDMEGGVQSRVRWGPAPEEQSPWLPGSTPQEHTVSGLAPNATYPVTVQAMDDAGNMAEAPGATITTPAPDTLAPNVTAVGVANVTQTAANITWTVDGSAVKSWVVWGIAGCTTAGPPQGGPGNHSTVLDGLEAATTYQYCIAAEDADGNQNLTAPATFTTLDWPPVAISGIGTIPLAATTIQVTWTVSGPWDVLSHVEYETGADAPFPPYTLASAELGGPGVKTLNVTGLTPGTLYNLRVVASSGTSGGTSSSANQQQVTLVPATITGCCGAGTIAAASAPADVPLTFQVTNVDSITHSWQIVDESYVSPSIAAGGVYTFATAVTLPAGTYTQQCTIHTSMIGTLTVA